MPCPFAECGSFKMLTSHRRLHRSTTTTRQWKTTTFRQPLAGHVSCLATVALGRMVSCRLGARMHAQLKTPAHRSVLN